MVQHRGILRIASAPAGAIARGLPGARHIIRGPACSTCLVAAMSIPIQIQFNGLSEAFGQPEKDSGAPDCTLSLVSDCTEVLQTGGDLIELFWPVFHLQALLSADEQKRSSFRARVLLQLFA